MSDSINDSMVGARFGRLTVVKQAPSKNKRSYWECKCDCGKIVVKMGKYLRNGDTRSCGCIASERAAEMGKRNIKRNSYTISEGVATVYLNNSGNSFLCDEDNLYLLDDITWFESENGYARGSINGKFVFFHVLAMGNGMASNLMCDHIDGDRLNNKKSNLRLVTLQQNMMNKGKYKSNSSGITGVSWNKCNSKWMAYICFNKRQINLGTYTDIEEAIAVRKSAEDQYFKEYKRSVSSC